MADQQGSQSPCRIVVMASGNGSNFQKLIDAVASGRIPNSQIARLVVNRKNAYAITRAESAGIPWECFNLISNGFIPKGEKDEEKVAEARRQYDAALAEKLLSEKERPDLVILAGWMHIFSTAFLEPLTSVGIGCINLHPALPGEFDGAMAIERAFDEFKAGRRTKTGLMVHYVVEEVDRGDPILVQEVEWEGEELDAFKEKMHSHEHELIVKAAAKVVEEILKRRAS